MPHNSTTSASGTVTHVFGHRFVVQTIRDAILADLTPEGLEQTLLRVGDTVRIEGEMKPSELKVTHFTSGGRTIIIDPKKKHHDHHHHHPDVDPGVAIEWARAAGFETIGQPLRKPKHFEVLGRRNDQLTELHIELDGHIRKHKLVTRNEPKWIEALRAP